MRWTHSVVVGALLSVCATSSGALTATLVQWSGNSTDLQSNVNDLECCGGNTQEFQPTSLPFTDSHQAEIAGGVIAQTSYSLSSDGFSIDFNHYRFARSSAQSIGSIYFELDQDATYSLSGQYALTGFRTIHFDADLSDLTAGQDLFMNAQESGLTTNQSFLLGGNAGDLVSQVSGSLDGSLVAGHLYRLTYDAWIGSTEAADASASASGFLQMALVPEPGTALLLGSGIATLVVLGRRLSG